MIPSAFITSSQSTKLSAALPCGKAACRAAFKLAERYAEAVSSCFDPAFLCDSFYADHRISRRIPISQIFESRFPAKSAPTALKTAGCVVQAFSGSVFASRFGFRMIRLSCTSGFSPAESTRSVTSEEAPLRAALRSALPARRMCRTLLLPHCPCLEMLPVSQPEPAFYSYLPYYSPSYIHTAHPRHICCCLHSLCFPAICMPAHIVPPAAGMLL